MHQFANSGANVSAKSDYIREQAVVQICVVGFTCQSLDFGEDDVIKWSLLYGNVFFFYDVAFNDPCHIIIVIEINQGPVFLELKECIDGHCISS
jgi:hypothetical protein